MSHADAAIHNPSTDSLQSIRWPGRVAIEQISPVVEGGAWPVKRVIGDEVVVEADIFSDGHEHVDGDLLWRAQGSQTWRRVTLQVQQNDRWGATFQPDKIGRFEFAIEAWRDPFATWVSDVTKKAAAGQSLEVELIEGLALVDQAQKAAVTQGESWTLTRPIDDSGKLLGWLLSPKLFDAMRIHGPRSGVSRSRSISLSVDRERAAFSSWYELFPRSTSSDPRYHGTFDDVRRVIPYVRDMGFDVLYFPPIHPIGRTNRKGRNNTLKAGSRDVGSVYAIGAAEGGHDAVHPELGDIDSFRKLVDEAKAHGLEVAMDIAWQCSPDHPWLKQHPQWFERRPDGSIKYAENPPKKYEDIVNLRFEGEAYPDVWFALRDVVLFWASHGVRIFRIDNPHTKPLPFWEWMIAEVCSTYPDAIFLAEAFTRPKMMKRLAKVGFQQSYTYFTWRNTKQEIIEYVSELTGEMSEYYRPNFFVNTPDINPYYLQTSGRAGFIVRATLAATLAGNWGIYSGFEICESAALPGREEYLDSEKYQIRIRDYDAKGNIRDHITRLNEIRRRHGALRQQGNVRFLNAWNENVLAYVRVSSREDEAIFVLVNLDPYRQQDCAYEIPLWQFGLPDHASIEAEDLIFGGRFTLYGKTHQIGLDPSHNPVVIWRLISPTVGG